MKFRPSFIVIVAVIVVVAAISAYFVFSDINPKIDESVDFVPDSPKSNANDVKNNSVSKPKIEHSQKLDDFSVSANSNLTKFEKLKLNFAENRITMSEFIRDLGKIIENIEEIDSKFSTDENIIKTAAYADFAEFRTQARHTFIARYRAYLSETVEFYCFWWEIDKAQKYVLDEKSGAGRYIPTSMFNAPELVEMFLHADEKIDETNEELKNISNDTKRFVANTLAAINEIESGEIKDEADLQENITDWHNAFALLMPKITDIERNALIPRVKNAYYSFETAYFKHVDTLQNDADVHFAVKYFPFSQKLFQQVLDKFDMEFTKETRILNKTFTVYEIFRHRFYNGFGLMNSTLSFSINAGKFDELLFLVDYLVFFTNHFAQDKSNKYIMTLVNQWIASISSTVEQTLKLSQTKTVPQNIRHICNHYNYLTVVLRIKHEMEIESISKNVAEIEKKQNVLKSVLSKMITHKSYSFIQVTMLLMDSAAYNQGEITEIIHQAVIEKVKSEFDSITKIIDVGQKNAAFAKMFAEIDELFSVLNYLKYPASKKLNTEIAKIIESVSQKDVITAIVDDENTINAIIAKLDKSTSLVFLGFLTDLYNRLLLTRKGAVDIDQKFIDENLLTLKAYSKAYAKLAEALKTMESTTPTNAYIFCKNYNKISKFSIVDRFIKDKRLFRTTLINSLEGKYQNQMSILTNFESLRNLKTMFSSIGKAKSWTEINQLKKIKSQIVNLVINNRENHLVFNGILISEELLERKFFDILEINWQVQPNENWLDHAKWFTRNFSLNSSHKNIIAEKIKTLINK